MLKVGLTGGLASGKSFVAGQLEKLKCHVIYADVLGHQVLMPDGEGYQQVLTQFGPEVLNADGTINRKTLGSLVFSDRERLQKLNNIVHPAVFRKEEQLLKEFQLQEPLGICVIEAAVLIEAGGREACDKIVVTSCRPETQIARAMARDHVTAEEARLRMERQLPDAERIRYADYVINTDGTPAETVAQVEIMHAELRQLAEAVNR